MEKEDARQAAQWFVAGLSPQEIGARLGISARWVRAALVQGAEPLWDPPTPPAALPAPEQGRCSACGILLNPLEMTWDATGMCDDCQESLEAVMRVTGLDRDEAYRLWRRPAPVDPARLTALEHWLERRAQQVAAR